MTAAGRGAGIYPDDGSMASFPTGPLLLLLAALGLGACDGAGERARAHYEQARALLAAGDAAGAEAEFRAALALDGAHAGARLAYADLLRARGEEAAALRQYLRAAEAAPDSLPAWRAAAGLALDAGDAATAGEAAAQALRIDPADPEARSVAAALDLARPETRARAVEAARGVIRDAPGTGRAHRVLIAERIEAGDAAGALALAGTAVAAAPADGELRLIQAGLRERAGDVDGAESALRAARARAPADPGTAGALVSFLIRHRGPEAAIGEIDRITAGGGTPAPDPRPFLRLRAGLVYDQGDQAGAIAALRALTGGGEPSGERRAGQLTLAGMLAGTGAAAEARRLLDGVLAEDPGLTGALALRARLAIEAGDPGQAIRDLRAAEERAPEDPEVMSLMALAQERAGNTGLAGERFARAVDLSRQAPGASLAYARFLMRGNQPGPAESVITAALRATPGDPDLLAMLGRIRVARSDWSGAAEAAAGLAAAGAPEQAAALELASLRGQDPGGRMAALLEDLAEDPDPAALLPRVRSRLAAGDAAGARRALEAAVARDPADPAARLMLAALARGAGDAATAERLARALTLERPELARGWLELADLLRAEGREAEADRVLAEGIAAAEEAPGGTAEGATLLLVARAAALERRGETEAAIALYERLHARDPAAAVIANNLASLLSTARADDESLARAEAIARDLADTAVPAFQDTYGWILFRRGDAAGALARLAPAAEADPGDARTWFHRAEAEHALGRAEAARASYARALAAAEAGAPLPEIATVRARLAPPPTSPGATPPAGPGSGG
ncbi:tetratricopeptide repeat protein [Amaricoccus solimangrovi]|uniref:Tetratricopeptide repeat protein n=2 Tax=Amaricoccus solimangrovi TaxID=2589815 RepID=A0A501WGA1_9RHOB|nr:tetratricopeptide repeat protein [Amaricoccus solimangrovi]